MDLANNLKKCRIRFSLSRPKSRQIHLKVSERKNTKITCSVISRSSRICITTLTTYEVVRARARFVDDALKTRDI